MLVIAQEAPRQPDVRCLIDASDAESASLYPPESRHGSSLDALEQPSCRFVVARDDGVAVGCGALLLDRPDAAEIKRVYVAAAARCRGIARRILVELEAIARAEDVHVLRLETGVDSHAAVALYRKLGFTECGVFGAYQPDPLSVFMEKPL